MFDRARLPCPTSLLSIAPILTSTTESYRPAYSMTGLVPGTLLLAGGGPVATPVGPPPHPYDEAMESLELFNGPVSNFIITSESEPSFFGSRVTFRALSNHFTILIQRGNRPRTLADLVSPDKDAALTLTKFSNTADLRAGDIIVTFKCQNAGARGSTVCVDEVNTVILCLPPFKSSECSDALVGHSSRTILVSIYNRVCEFLQCWDYALGEKLTFSKARYDKYEQSMDTALQNLKSISAVEVANKKKRWWAELDETLEDEDVPEKKIKSSPP